MTRVWRKRVKVIGLYFSLMMVALWVFSILFVVSYNPYNPWSFKLSLGSFSIRHHQQNTNIIWDPGWQFQRAYPYWKEVSAALPWTEFAHNWLGFSLPRKDFQGIIRIPVWLLVLATGLPTAILLWRDRRPKAGFCEVCKYDLTGNESGTCPECGTAVDSRDSMP